MSDVWALALAAAAFVGAVVGADGHVRPVPLAVAAAVVLAALAARRPAWLCLGVAVLAAALAQRSVAGLTPPQTGPVRAEVTLVSDPEPDGRGGVAVDVRLGDRRLRATARAAPAAALDDRLTGERALVVGRVERPSAWERRLRHRHLAGRLTVETVVGWRPGHGVTRVANTLRRTLADGAEPLPERQRSLLAGLTLGDDRAQPADLADAFEAAGLTHLLAVSGQNVAFSLVVVAPLLVRLRFGPRLAATLAVLAGFALVTRFEPSVLRATAMAAVAATGAALGRPSSSRRALGLGVAGILLVDPLLATSLGFQLSAAGAAGIVLVAGPIERALPGPRWLAAPLSVTIAAQLAVSPLLVTAFGALPVASLPANLLAGPVAGPIMVWGLTAGLVAGVLGGPAAAVLHLPSRAMLTWLEAVAQACAGAPLGTLGARELVALASGVSLLATARHRARTPAAADPSDSSGPSDSTPGPVRPRRRGLALSAVGLAVVVGALVAAGRPPSAGTGGPIDLGLGATGWVGDRAVVVVLDGRARADLVLRGLRRDAVTRVDVVVLRSGARGAADVAATIRRRWPDAGLLAPPPTPDGRAPPEGTVIPPTGAAIDVGDLRISIRSSTPGHLDLTIAPTPPDAPRNGASGGP